MYEWIYALIGFLIMLGVLVGIAVGVGAGVGEGGMSVSTTVGIGVKDWQAVSKPVSSNTTVAMCLCVILVPYPCQ